MNAGRGIVVGVLAGALAMSSSLAAPAAATKAAPAAAAATAAKTVTPAPAAGDAVKGEKVFAKCKICHEVSAEKNKIGPYLKGVIGRKAGAAKGFAYSPAMKASGIVWADDKIRAFVNDPKKLVPNNKMTFVGIKKADEVDNLIAYLKQAAK